MHARILNVMLKTKHMNILLATLCSHLELEQEHTELLNARDTSDVWRQFAIWLLVGPDDGVIRFTQPGSREREAIQHVADLYIQKCKDRKRWEAAKDTAWSAADEAAYDPAYDAAWSAAKAAYYAAKTAAEDAWYAACAARADAFAAAATAEDAAEAVHNAADAAWDAYCASADAAEASAEDAWYAAADACDGRMTDKLIELINAAPIKEPV